MSRESLDSFIGFESGKNSRRKEETEVVCDDKILFRAIFMEGGQFLAILLVVVNVTLAENTLIIRKVFGNQSISIHDIGHLALTATDGQRFLQKQMRFPQLLQKQVVFVGKESYHEIRDVAESL